MSITIIDKIWRCPACKRTLSVDTWTYEDLAENGTPVCNCDADMELVDNPSPEAKYIATGGTRCPFCNSDDLESGECDSDENGKYEGVRCCKCGTTGVEQYILACIDWDDKVEST